MEPVSASALYTPLQEGMRQFHARRYSMALGPLERAVSKTPNDATSRYYLANCYVHLGRHEDAQREYDMAYRLDPFGPVSGYCRRALLGYGISVPDDAELFAGRKSVARKVAMQPSDTISHNSPQHLNRAVDTIRRQADFEKSRHKQTAEVFGNNVIKSGEGAAKKILDDAVAECKAIMDAPINLVSVTGTGGSFVTNAVLEQARATEMERLEKEFYSLMDELHPQVESHDEYNICVAGSVDDKQRSFVTINWDETLYAVAQRKYGSDVPLEAIYEINNMTPSVSGGTAGKTVKEPVYPGGKTYWLPARSEVDTLTEKYKERLKELL